jgi:hypothetical protein
MILSSTLAFGCDCDEQSVKETKKWADTVFRGKVVSFRLDSTGQRQVTFRVDRVWKGKVGLTFEMPALERVQCLSFRGNLLVIGNELLVYAHKYEGLRGYYTGECSRTNLAAGSPDLRQLGRGQKPKSK